MSSLSVISGIVAAAAGLAGDKVGKDGAIAGLDIAGIITALSGKSSGTGLFAELASTVAKSGILGSDLSRIADLASTVIATAGGKVKTSGANISGIEGLASAIAGTTGKAADLSKIANLALTLGKEQTTGAGLTKLASTLGKTLKDKYGVSLNLPDSGGLKNLAPVLPAKDTKSELLKTILKNLV